MKKLCHMKTYKTSLNLPPVILIVILFSVPFSALAVNDVDFGLNSDVPDTPSVSNSPADGAQAAGGYTDGSRENESAGTSVSNSPAAGAQAAAGHTDGSRENESDSTGTGDFFSTMSGLFSDPVGTAFNAVNAATGMFNDFWNGDTGSSGNSSDNNLGGLMNAGFTGDFGPADPSANSTPSWFGQVGYFDGRNNANFYESEEKMEGIRGVFGAAAADMYWEYYNHGMLDRVAPQNIPNNDNDLPPSILGIEPGPTGWTFWTGGDDQDGAYKEGYRDMVNAMYNSDDSTISDDYIEHLQWNENAIRDESQEAAEAYIEGMRHAMEDNDSVSNSASTSHSPTSYGIGRWSEYIGTPASYSLGASNAQYGTWSSLTGTTASYSPSLSNVMNLADQVLGQSGGSGTTPTTPGTTHTPGTPTSGTGTGDNTPGSSGTVLIQNAPSSNFTVASRCTTVPGQVEVAVRVNRYNALWNYGLFIDGADKGGISAGTTQPPGSMDRPHFEPKRFILAHSKTYEISIRHWTIFNGADWTVRHETPPCIWAYSEVKSAGVSGATNISPPRIVFSDVNNVPLTGPTYAGEHYRVRFGPNENNDAVLGCVLEREREFGSFSFAATSGSVVWGSTIFGETPSSAGIWKYKARCLSAAGWSAYTYANHTIVAAPALQIQTTATPNPVLVNNPVTWTSQVSGGIGDYIYAWRPAGASLSSTPASAAATYQTTYTSVGNKTVQLNVTSGTQTKNVTSGDLLVSYPAPSLTFTADTSEVGYKETANLNWSSNEWTDTPCLASGTWSGNKPKDGTEDSVPLTEESNVFRLTCSPLSAPNYAPPYSPVVKQVMVGVRYGTGASISATCNGKTGKNLTIYKNDTCQITWSTGTSKPIHCELRQGNGAIPGYVPLNSVNGTMDYKAEGGEVTLSTYCEDGHNTDSLILKVLATFEEV